MTWPPSSTCAARGCTALPGNSAGRTTEPRWRLAGAVDTTDSPHARLRPVPIHAVTMHDGFWKPRLEGNRTSGIAAFLAWLDEDGQVAPFRAYAHFARTGDTSRIPAALDTMRAVFEGRNSRRMRHTWRAAVDEGG